VTAIRTAALTCNVIRNFFLHSARVPLLKIRVASQFVFNPSG